MTSSRTTAHAAGRAPCVRRRRNLIHISAAIAHSGPRTTSSTDRAERVGDRKTPSRRYLSLCPVDLRSRDGRRSEPAPAADFTPDPGARGQTLLTLRCATRAPSNNPVITYWTMNAADGPPRASAPTTWVHRLCGSDPYLFPYTPFGVRRFGTYRIVDAVNAQASSFYTPFGVRWFGTGDAIGFLNTVAQNRRNRGSSGLPITRNG
jgi:hypothetical protein